MHILEGSQMESMHYTVFGQDSFPSNMHRWQMKGRSRKLSPEIDRLLTNFWKEQKLDLLGIKSHNGTWLWARAEADEQEEGDACLNGDAQNFTVTWKLIRDRTPLCLSLLPPGCVLSFQKLCTKLWTSSELLIKRSTISYLWWNKTTCKTPV